LIPFEFIENRDKFKKGSNQYIVSNLKNEMTKRYTEKEFRRKANDSCLKMRKIFPPTPLQKNEYLSEKYNSNIFLKREDLSPVRSYKIRGACNAMGNRPNAKHFVCASAGNHAQGVAFMAAFFGVKSTIFMPTTTPQQKISKTLMFGGENIEIRVEGDYFDECLSAAKDFSSTEDCYFLSPFDDVDVITGQATVGVEIEQQLGFVPDQIIIPVGGGGLSSGLMKYFGKGVKFKLVEPLGAPSLTEALIARRTKKLAQVDSFMDGAAVAEIGKLNFSILRETNPADVITIAENRVCCSILEMLNTEGMVLEPAGALSIDVLKDISHKIIDQNIVCITTGGNFDFERLPEIKERAAMFMGTKKYLILRLPQRPGSLREFLEILGPNEDITRFEYLKKSARNFGTVLLGIEASRKEDFVELFSKLENSGYSYQDISDDPVLAGFLI
tara:strand:+ start:1190 stop:2518 length:1329 start_codon:yes stop_codon:yes gene_type:complete